MLCKEPNGHGCSMGIVVHRECRRSTCSWDCFLRHNITPRRPESMTSAGRVAHLRNGCGQTSWLAGEHCTSGPEPGGGGGGGKPLHRWGPMFCRKICAGG